MPVIATTITLWQHSAAVQPREHPYAGIISLLVEYHMGQTKLALSLLFVTAASSSPASCNNLYASPTVDYVHHHIKTEHPHHLV